VEVRRLQAGEGAQLRRLRLRALADAPDAFGATLDGDAAHPDGWWDGLADAGAGAVFVAEEAGEWSGMAGVHLAGADEWTASLWGMWVAPRARGRGIGSRLVGAVVDWARVRGLRRVELTVSQGAPGAEALYRAIGFVRTGEERSLASIPSLTEATMMLPVDDSGPPRLETERLLLRPFTLDDAPAMTALQAGEGVTRWLYWEARDEQETRKWLAGRIARRRFTLTGDGLGFAVELKESAELVGDCSLMLASAEHRQGEVGYIFDSRHWGHGYATEAARALVEFAFSTYGLHRIAGRAEARNVASAGVLERLGMRREAHLVENEYVKGEWQSEVVYALLAREWAR
jgi:RimJ/RimL family protein N-acetyltransferase